MQHNLLDWEGVTVMAHRIRPNGHSAWSLIVQTEWHILAVKTPPRILCRNESIDALGPTQISRDRSPQPKL